MSGSPWPVVLAVLSAVTGTDQVTKWWGWRRFPAAMVNPGGDWFVGGRVGAWYADPVRGPLLDLVGLAVVITAVVLLARRPRPRAVLVTGAMMIGGWASNLLDRLGLHALTAPYSGRGAVDFLVVGQAAFNVADLTIAVATPLFLLFLGRQRTRVRIPAFLGAACFLGMLAFGAATHGV